MTSPAQCAAEQRAAFGLGPTEPVLDLLGAVENTAGVPVFQIPLGDNGHFDGLYAVSGGEGLIVINSSVHHARRRFSLAHELGHHALGHGAQVDDQISFADTRQIEKDANDFAGHLLLPEEAIAAWRPPEGSAAFHLDNIARIACDFGVSAQVALIRLKVTGAVTDPALITILERQIREKKHRAVIRKKQLDTWDDAITSASDHVRLPKETASLASGLVEDGRLSAEALEAWTTSAEAERES